MEKVLVTGITGNSGKYLAEELLNRFPEDMSFRLIIRNEAKAGTLKKMVEKGLPVEIFKGDIGSEESLDQMTKGMDTVLHIAGIGSSLNLVKAAIKNDAKKLILVHTTGIYSKYKAAGEGYRLIEAEIREMIKGKDISLVILRPTMIYGSLNDQNMVKFIKMVDKIRLFPCVSGGHFALQPVHQQDLGIAYYQVLTNFDKLTTDDYTLSGGTVIDLIDILGLIGNYLGKKTTFFRFPFWLAYLGAWGLYLVTLKKKDYREKVQRLVEPRAYSHEVATRDFGYAPMPFAEGLKREVTLYIDAKGRN